MFNKVAFTLYPVIDIRRARKFYEEILGLELSKLSAEGNWVEYDLPGGGCFVITNLAQDVGPSANSGGSIAFEVDSLDSLIAELQAKGVEVKLDVFHTPVCQMAVIIDSEGNALTLHQLNKKD